MLGATEHAAHSEWTVPEIEKLASDIQRLADAMFVVAQILPEVDEGQQAKSLSQRARHLPPDTQKKPEEYPQASGE